MDKIVVPAPPDVPAENCKPAEPEACPLNVSVLPLVAANIVVIWLLLLTILEDKVVEAEVPEPTKPARVVPEPVILTVGTEKVTPLAARLNLDEFAAVVVLF